MGLQPIEFDFLKRLLRTKDPALDLKKSIVVLDMLKEEQIHSKAMPFICRLLGFHRPVTRINFEKYKRLLFEDYGKGANKDTQNLFSALEAGLEYNPMKHQITLLRTSVYLHWIRVQTPDKIRYT